MNISEKTLKRYLKLAEANDRINYNEFEDIREEILEDIEMDIEIGDRYEPLVLIEMAYELGKKESYMINLLKDELEEEG